MIWVSPSLGFGIDFRVKDLDYPALRKLVAQWRSVITNYFGDFYPLTQCSRDTTHWIAWQFNCPETNSGLIQAFRRENSQYESIRLKINGLDPSANYKFINLDTPYKPNVFKGNEIMKTGLTVKVEECPGVAIITYQKQQ